MSDTNWSVFGAAARAADSLRNVLGNHDRLAIGLVFFAGIITIAHKAGVPIPHYAMLFALALGIAALLYEMNATTYALRSFWNGRLVGTIGWSFVWAVAFLYSMSQWIGAASETEGAKSNIHKAAYHATTDIRDELTSAKAEVARLEQRLRIAPARNAEQAQAAIGNAMAHKFWKTTDGCKSTKGPQTREFCSAYASAVADKAGATEMLVVAEDMKAAKARLAKAQATAASTKTEVSESRNDLVILTKYAGMNEDDARTLNALGSIIAISIFLSIATALRELEHLRSTQRRTPMFPIRRLYASFYRAMTGKDLPAPSHTREIIRDDGFAARIAALRTT